MNPRGRPKLHPEGTTTAERTRLSRARNGTTAVTLDAEMIEALDAIKDAAGDANRVVTLGRLIAEERERRGVR